jgi:hypothetical protein
MQVCKILFCQSIALVLKMSMTKHLVGADCACAMLSGLLLAFHAMVL